MARSDEPVAPPASMVDRSVGQALGDRVNPALAIQSQNRLCPLLTHPIANQKWCVAANDVMCQ